MSGRPAFARWTPVDVAHLRKSCTALQGLHQAVIQPLYASWGHLHFIWSPLDRDNPSSGAIPEDPGATEKAPFKATQR